MEDQEKTETSSVEPAAGSANGSPAKKQPLQTLPSDRLADTTWVDAIAAYVAGAEANNGTVDNKEAAKALDMSSTSIVVTNAFYVDIGLLKRSSAASRFEVADEAKAYVQAKNWGTENAGHKLKPLFADKWFSKALLPLLKIRTYTIKEACGILANAAGGGIGQEYKAHLQRIVFFLDFVGLCKLEAGVLSTVMESPAEDENKGGKEKAVEQESNGAIDPERLIPDDAVYIPLNKERDRVAIVIAPPDLSKPELDRIQAWLKMNYFIDEA